MSQKSYESEGLYRFSIIAPLINETFAKGELKKKIRELAGKHYEHPLRGWEKFAFKTIEEWLYNYRRCGLSGLEKNRRKDTGLSRSISPEIGELILTMKKENPKRSAGRIIKELAMAGKTRPGEMKRSSVYRLLSNHRQELKAHGEERKQIRKFAFEFSNECWQSDVCHGPYLYIEGHRNKRKIYLYAFIDDASRIIPHMGIAFAENLENFLECLKTGIQKKGIPHRLYLDNAAYYRSPVVSTIGARLGIKVIYCTPYSPYKKGKIERFWRTCREGFLSCLDRNRRYTLAELNRLAQMWVEKDYHHNIHSSLGKSPLEAWQSKAQNINYPDIERLERDFLAEESRKVRKDGTFSLKGTCCEADTMLAGEKVTVRYNPFKRDRVFVYLKDQFMQEAKAADEIENSKAQRQPVPDLQKPVSSGINFLDLLQKEEKSDV